MAMVQTKRLAALLLALLLTLFLLPSAWADSGVVGGTTVSGTVRVYLSSISSLTAVDVSIAGSYSVGGDTSRALSRGQNIRVSNSGGTLMMTANGQTQTMGSRFKLRRHQTSGENGVRIAQARYPASLYPGDIEFIAKGGNVQIVVHVYMEDYMLGVLPYEMDNSFPLEALKAQAVAARTYALKKMSVQAATYDVVDTTSDQVYNGTPSGNARCAQAVQETSGIVGTVGGEYMASYYTASNGGQTESVKNAWGSGSYSYLQVKDDPYDLRNGASIAKSVTFYRNGTTSVSALTELLRTEAAMLVGAGNVEIASINGVTLADYDSILDGMAAETEPQTVLAESATVNYAVYQVLENNPVLTVKDAADPLLAMKGVKNEVELAHLRESHLRDAVAMVRFQIELENRLASGEQLTELTVDEILHKYRSADDKFLVESFGTIAAYGGNAAMMHYHATPEDHAVLQRKGFLLVDSGATYLDGTTDITRTYPLGELTEDERLFYTWTLQCHIDIAKAVWLDYCDCHMLDTIAREPLWRHLINYRCGTGHSVSFVGNVHEGPHALNGRNTTLMRPGMIVTDEPGVYEAGEVGIRIENEIECYHKADNQYGTFLAFRPLTFVPIATSPIVPGVLDKEQVAWLNDYHRKVFEQLAPRLTEDERAWLAEKCAAIGC